MEIETMAKAFVLSINTQTSIYINTPIEQKTVTVTITEVTTAVTITLRNNNKCNNI